MKLEDYVMILPQKKMQDTGFFHTKMGDIKIHSNIYHIERFLCDDRYMNAQSRSDIIGTVNIVCKPGLFKNEVNRFISGQFIRKDDKIYSEGIENTIFCNGDSSLLVNHYPVGSIFYYNESQNDAVCVIPTEDVAGFLAKMAVKRVCATYYYKAMAYFSMHAAGVIYQNRAFLFAAGGRAGKTTAYLNLVNDRYYPINDDIVFWKYGQEGIIIDSIPLKVNIRESSIPYLKFTLDKRICEKGFDSEFYVSTESLLNKSLLTTVRLEAIFIPETGHSKTRILKVEMRDYLKRMLRCCMAHSSLVADENFAIAFNKLAEYPLYKIEISDSVEDFLACFNAFIDSAI